MARVLAVGGCHWDIRYVGKRELIPGESTPATSKRSPGGAVSNVARTLRGLGHQVSIASVVGNTPSPEDDLRLFRHVPDLPPPDDELLVLLDRYAAAESPSPAALASVAVALRSASIPKALVAGRWLMFAGTEVYCWVWADDWSIEEGFVAIERFLDAPDLLGPDDL